MSFLSRLLGANEGEFDPPELRAEIEKATAALAAATTALDSTWGLGRADWTLDQDAGTLVFTTADGIMVVAPAQIVGTYNVDDESWLWAWDHPSVLPALKADAERLLEYGRERGFEKLTTRKFRCTESEAWELTALAFHICGTSGAYRGPSGSTMVFMTFREIKFTTALTGLAGS